MIINRTEQNRLHQSKHKAKKAETQQQVSIWLDKELVAQIKTRAEQKGWVSEVGRNAGKAHLGKAIENLINLGFEKLDEEK